MLTLSKGIEPGDWLTFFGTLVGALIGALIAGGIAIYVAHLQNKHQNNYIEKQNELDKRVKKYELNTKMINDSMHNLNDNYFRVTKLYYDLLTEKDKDSQRRLVGELIATKNKITNYTITYKNYLLKNSDFSDDSNDLKEATDKVIDKTKSFGDELARIGTTSEVNGVNTSDVKCIGENIKSMAPLIYKLNQELQNTLSQQLKRTYK
ncbi:hypothetical protein IM157_01105 [Staphylococcus epidermidis]|nr:hypothetical protein [Staphylococcus epidermidis]